MNILEPLNQERIITGWHWTDLHLNYSWGPDELRSRFQLCMKSKKTSGFILCSLIESCSCSDLSIHRALKSCAEPTPMFLYYLRITFMCQWTSGAQIQNEILSNVILWENIRGLWQKRTLLGRSCESNAAIHGLNGNILLRTHFRSTLWTELRCCDFHIWVSSHKILKECSIATQLVLEYR